MTSLVNTETGEIVETTALAPVNTGSEVAVTSYLAQARDWLARAVDETGPEQIAAAKAEIATAAEATKQLGLAKEIQEDAIEMVRRADYALGKAIRRGQEEGTVARLGDGRGERSVQGTNLSSPTDFASDVELYDRPSQGKYGILSLAEATPEEFEVALEKARAEGNLSRANVARKVKGGSAAPSPAEPSRLKATERVEQIRELAEQGKTSEQIARSLGLGIEYIQKLVREYGLTVRADVVRGRARRLDSNRILSGTADALSAAAFSLQQIDPLDLDQESAQEWVDSLTDSLSIHSPITLRR